MLQLPRHSNLWGRLSAWCKGIIDESIRTVKQRHSFQASKSHDALVTVFPASMFGLAVAKQQIHAWSNTVSTLCNHEFCDGSQLQLWIYRLLDIYHRDRIQALIFAPWAATTFFDQLKDSLTVHKSWLPKRMLIHQFLSPLEVLLMTTFTWTILPHQRCVTQLSKQVRKACMRNTWHRLNLWKVKFQSTLFYVQCNNDKCTESWSIL